MTLVALLMPVKLSLQARGLAVVQHQTYIEVVTDGARVSIENRPVYCDRGRFIVKVRPQGAFALEFDAQDGFPRYYFGVEECASEIHAWLEARKLVPV